MAKIGIICALEREIDLFVENFNACKTENPQIYHGSFLGHDIYLSLCGVGKVNAAISAQRLIDGVSPDFVINSGIAGGISHRLKTGDVAVSSVVTYHDIVHKELFEHYPPYTVEFKADSGLIALAENACESLCAEADECFSYETGVVVSGDVFVDNSSYREKLKNEYNAICTEMEGAAIGHAALINNVPFVVIRAISDNADDNAQITYKQLCDIASGRAYSIVRKMISML